MKTTPLMIISLLLLLWTVLMFLIGYVVGHRDARRYIKAHLDHAMRTEAALRNKKNCKIIIAGSMKKAGR